MGGMNHGFECIGSEKGLRHTGAASILLEKSMVEVYRDWFFYIRKEVP